MQNKNGITSFQMIMMLTVISAVYPFAFVPIFNVSPYNHDVWLAYVLALPMMAVVALPVLFLSFKYRGFTIGEIVNQTLGRVVGAISLVLIAAVFFCGYFENIFFIVQFVKLNVLGNSPVWFIVLLTVLPAAYVLIKGPRVVAKTVAVFMPLFLLAVLCFFLMGMGKMNLENLRPVMAESTFPALLKGALQMTSRFSDSFILLMFGAGLRRRVGQAKNFFIALAIYFALFMLMIMPVLLALGYPYASAIMSPYNVYVRNLTVYDFIQRLHSFNVLIWFPVSILKAAIYGTMACLAVKDLCKFKDVTVTGAVMSLVVAVLCFIPFFWNPAVSIALKENLIIPTVTSCVLTFIVLILCIVYFFRRKALKRNISERRHLVGQEDNDSPVH